jgi:Asp-tRNA(Asn)/Glu-tRNA(Gln) amidotransferase C subunit
MTTALTPADVTRLAEMSGLHLPDEDLLALAEALGGHLDFVDPLLSADLDDTNPALTHDPRWRE